MKMISLNTFIQILVRDVILTNSSLNERPLGPVRRTIYLYQTKQTIHMVHVLIIHYKLPKPDPELMFL